MHTVIKIPRARHKYCNLHAAAAIGVALLQRNIAESSILSFDTHETVRQKCNQDT